MTAPARGESRRARSERLRLEALAAFGRAHKGRPKQAMDHVQPTEKLGRYHVLSVDSLVEGYITLEELMGTRPSFHIVSGAQPPLNVDDLEMRARLAYALSFVRADRLALLHEIAGGATYRTLAAARGVTRSAVHKQVRLAREEAAKAIADHLEELDVRHLPLEELL